MDVIEVRNPRALLQPDVQLLIKRAVESGAFIAPHGFDQVAKDIFNFVTDESNFMLMGAEGGKWLSLILGYYPAGNLFPYPTIVLLYNEGSRKLRNAMKKKLLATITAAGYTRALAVNSTQRDDDVWLRAMTPEGVNAETIGSLVMLEVT